jgi:hypothetical protein
MSTDLFSSAFYLLHESGDRLYPVKMKNQDTGRIAYRVSRGGTGGNTKEASLEVDEAEMVRYVTRLGYAVRASTRDRKRFGQYKVGERSIKQLVARDS